MVKKGNLEKKGENEKKKKPNLKKFKTALIRSAKEFLGYLDVEEVQDQIDDGELTFDGIIEEFVEGILLPDTASGSPLGDVMDEFRSGMESDDLIETLVTDSEDAIRQLVTKKINSLDLEFYED